MDGYKESNFIASDNELESKTFIEFVDSKGNPKVSLVTQIFASVACGALQSNVGVTFSFSSVTLPLLVASQEHYTNSTLNYTLTWQQGVVFATSPSIGAILGSLISSFLMYLFGHRRTMLVTLPFYCSTWVGLALTDSFAVILLSRILQGACCSIFEGATYNFVAEIAYKTVRSQIVATMDLARQFGFFYICVVGLSNLTWQQIGLVTGLLPNVLSLILLFMHSSPRWLMSKSKKNESLKALKFYRGKNFYVEDEYEEIEDQFCYIDKNANFHQRLKLYLNRTVAKQFFIISFVLAATNFTGNTALFTYATTVFQSINSDIGVYVSAIIISLSKIFGVLLYIILSTHLKLRSLLIVPLFLAGVCTGILGLYFYFQINDYNLSYINWLPLLLLMLYTVLNMIAIPVLFLIRSEILPTELRPIGVGINYIIFFASFAIGAYSHPYMVLNLGSHWTFIIYSVIMFMIVLIVAFTVPETKGLSLEKIQENYISQIPPKKTSEQIELKLEQTKL